MLKNTIDDLSSSTDGRPEPIPFESNAWYYRTWIIFLAVIFVGPLALPLIWFKPKTSIVWKVLWTVVIGGLTYWASIGALESYKNIKVYYDELSKTLK
jgi:hypothetical protein